MRSFQWAVGEVRYGRGGPSHGRMKKEVKECYREHFEVLEEKMKNEGREWLEWTVQEGWTPVCTWLEKDVPEGEAFPMGNAIEQWRVRQSQEIFKPKVIRALKKMAVYAIIIVAVAIGMWSKLTGSGRRSMCRTR